MVDNKNSFINDAINHLHAMNEHCIVCSTDTNGILTRVNDNFCQITGYSQSELIGHTHNLISSGEHSDEFYKELWHTISAGKIWKGEIKDLSKDGEPIWLKTTIFPHLDTSGKPYSFTTVRTDITHLKLAEQSILEANERTDIRRSFFLSLLSDISLLQLEKNAAFDELAKRTCDIRHIDRLHFWQYQPEAENLICLGFYDAQNPDSTISPSITKLWNIKEYGDNDNILIKYADKTNNIIEKAYFEKNNISMQIIIPVKSNHEITGLIICDQYINEAWNEENTVLLIALAPYTLFLIEYHNQKETKQKLLESEMRFTLSQNFANIGTWDWHIETGELFWSEKIAYLFGYHQSIPETTYENFIRAIHPDDKTYVEDAVAACINEDKHYDIEHRVIWNDGSVHWLHESGGTIKNINGKPVRMLGVVRDITEHVHADHELIKSKEEADKANQAKSEFLSRMSHELRTPMNAILGFTQLLQMNETINSEEILKNFTQEIYDASNHLLHLINEVLDLSIIESGNFELHIEPVEINLLIEECCTLTTPMFNKRNIKLITNHQPAENNYILADKTRAKQVIVNLMSNAAKYSFKDNTVTIGYHQTEDDSWRIFIKDNGPGISADNQKKLFEAFNRLDAGNTLIEGTGIGLALSKDLIDVMNGKIGCNSSLETGSEFWLELPKTQEVNKILPKTDTLRQHFSEDIGKTINILYIEDSPTNRALVSKIFENEERICLSTSATAIEGLEAAYRDSPDLILLDIHLPLLDGFEVLKRLKLHDSTKNIPVIAVTANAMQENKQKCLKAGFNDYITKPFDIQGFYLKIYSLFLEQA